MPAPQLRVEQTPFRGEPITPVTATTTPAVAPTFQVQEITQVNNQFIYRYTGLSIIEVNTQTMAETVYKMIENQTKPCKNILIMPDTYFTINNEINDMIALIMRVY